MPVALACPSCHGRLVVARMDERDCARCATTYRRDKGVWCFLDEARREAVREFALRYSIVRRDEGRCVTDRDRLEALPFRSPSPMHGYEWAVRTQSFEALLLRVIEPLERTGERRRTILDLGSGVGWLAYRLAERGLQYPAVHFPEHGRLARAGVRDQVVPRRVHRHHG